MSHTPVSEGDDKRETPTMNHAPVSEGDDEMVTPTMSHAPASEDNDAIDLNYEPCTCPIR